MGNTSSDTRTVIVIVAVVGLLSCGCMCVPLGLLGLGVGLPAAVQVQKAAQAVAENRPPANEFAASPPEVRPVIESPPIVPLPVEPPPVTPPPATPVPNIAPPDLPPPQFSPPTFRPPTSPRPTRPPRETTAAGGLATLSEQQRRGIYFSATIHRQMLNTIEDQRAKTRARGGNVDFLEQMVESTRQRMNEQLDRLCERNRLTRAELDQLIAEGDQQGWGAPRKK